MLSYNYLSWRAVGLNYEALSAVVGTNATLAFVGFVAFHIAIVALGLPGGGILAVTAGVLFGWLTGIAAAMAGAVLGAQSPSSSPRGRPLVECSQRVRRYGSSASALALVRTGSAHPIVLRVIGVPGFLVNLGAALLGVRLKPFVLGTLIGILPPVTAFTYLGSVIGVGIAAQNANFSARRRPSPRRRCRLPLWHRLERIPRAGKFFIAATLLAGLALLPVILKNGARAMSLSKPSYSGLPSARR